MWVEDRKLCAADSLFDLGLVFDGLAEILIPRLGQSTSMIIDGEAQGDLARPFVAGRRQSAFDRTPRARSARAGKSNLPEGE